MTRFLSLLIAESLIAGPSLAGGIVFDLPHLTFPETAAPVTQSTSGPATPIPVVPQD